MQPGGCNRVVVTGWLVTLFQAFPSLQSRLLQCLILASFGLALPSISAQAMVACGLDRD